MSQIKRQGLLFCLLGPSASGKSTLAKKLLEDFSDSLQPSVSYTSRTSRAGEIEGKDYYFVSRQDFQQKSSEGFFFEWEENHGNLYGTPKEPIDSAIKSGMDVILDIDIKGAHSFKDNYSLNTISVFLLPPTPEELKSRMLKRGTISQEEMQRRLKTAQIEYDMFLDSSIDYCVVNQSLKETYLMVSSILIAERCKRLRIDSDSLRQFCKPGK